MTTSRLPHAAHRASFRKRGRHPGKNIMGHRLQSQPVHPGFCRGTVEARSEVAGMLTAADFAWRRRVHTRGGTTNATGVRQHPARA